MYLPFDSLTEGAPVPTCPEWETITPWVAPAMLRMTLTIKKIFVDFFFFNIELKPVSLQFRLPLWWH